MAATWPALDAYRLRTDFAVFDELLDGRPVAYLDSASSTQKPRQVLDRMRTFYEHEYANVHRGVYRLAERATEGFEGRGTAVRGSSTHPPKGDRVHAERDRGHQPRRVRVGARQPRPRGRRRHHGARAPRELRAVAVRGRTHGASFRNIPIDDQGELQLDALETIAGEGNVKVVANNLVSNTLGTINPVELLAQWAHEQGAIMVVDAAQAAPHRRVDVQALGADFVAISSHKLCGPTGIGALWGKRELLEAMSPFNFGGEMIRSVSLDRTTFNELRYSSRRARPRSARPSASVPRSTTSPPSAWRRSSGTSQLVEQTMAALEELPWITVFGPPVDRRAGIVSFDVEGIHPHDVAQILDWEGVAVR